MQSSAKCSWVEYLLSSFWYCGIFLIMVVRSFRLAFSPEDVMRLLSMNFFNCLVTALQNVTVKYSPCQASVGKMPLNNSENYRTAECNFSVRTFFNIHRDIQTTWMWRRCLLLFVTLKTEVCHLALSLARILPIDCIWSVVSARRQNLNPVHWSVLCHLIVDLCAISQAGKLSKTSPRHQPVAELLNYAVPLGTGISTKTLSYVIRQHQPWMFWMIAAMRTL